MVEELDKKDDDSKETLLDVIEPCVEPINDESKTQGTINIASYVSLMSMCLSHINVYTTLEPFPLTANYGAPFNILYILLSGSDRASL